MARKKLFGNARDPRCETCLHGRRSSDGDSVLCQRGGVLPLSHHCRHFQYDPLRRTPNRVRPLEEFDAAEFALDDLSAEWLEAVSKEEPSPEDVQHNELMKKLRTYLNETASPNVDDILVLLNETPVTAVDTEALLAEADALLEEPAYEKSVSSPPPAAEKAPLTESATTPTEFSELEKILGTAEPITEETDAVSETPSTTELPEAEQTPVIENPSVIEETPAIEETPVIEETLEIEEAFEMEEISEIEETLEPEDIPMIEDVPMMAVPQVIETILENEETVTAEEVFAKEQAETLLPADTVVPASNDEVAPISTTWHSDSSLDITGDLERLTVDVVQSSTPAAFRYFDLKFDDSDQPVEERDDIQIEGEETFSEDALLTTPQGSDYDEETLRAEDLIFLSEMQLIDEDNDIIEMNADGTFTQFKEH